MMHEAKKVLIMITALTIIFTGGCSALQGLTRSSSTGTDTLQYAEFSGEYIEKRRHQVFVEIPPAYELMQVGIALTDTSQAQPYRYIHPNNPYYDQVLGVFGEHEGHPFISGLNESLSSPTSVRSIFAYQLQEGEIVTDDTYGVDHLS